MVLFKKIQKADSIAALSHKMIVLVFFLKHLIYNGKSDIGGCLSHILEIDERILSILKMWKNGEFYRLSALFMMLSGRIGFDLLFLNTWHKTGKSIYFNKACLSFRQIMPLAAVSCGRYTDSIRNRRLFAIYRGWLRFFTKNRRACVWNLWPDADAWKARRRSF